MTCLVHNPRYRSLFHGAINEFRNGGYLSTSASRSMPRACCTCKNNDEFTLKSVVLNDEKEQINLKNLLDKINQDKRDTPKLVLAFNQLENIVKEKNQSSSQINSDEHDLMDTNTQLPKTKTKSVKPLKNGIFLFLPYKFEENAMTYSSIEELKKQQCGRFIGRTGFIAKLEAEHNVHVSMITSSTTEQVTKTLENAKNGIGKVTIHDQMNLSDMEDGEWILIRAKKSLKKNDTIDFESILNDLKHRWECCLKIKKRKNEEKEGHRKRNCKFVLV